MALFSLYVFPSNSTLSWNVNMDIYSRYPTPSMVCCYNTAFRPRNHTQGEWQVCARCYVRLLNQLLLACFCIRSWAVGKPVPSLHAEGGLCLGPWEEKAAPKLLRWVQSQTLCFPSFNNFLVVSWLIGISGISVTLLICPFKLAWYCKWTSSFQPIKMYWHLLEPRMVLYKCQLSKAAAYITVRVVLPCCTWKRISCARVAFIMDGSWPVTEMASTRLSV